MQNLAVVIVLKYYWISVFLFFISFSSCTKDRLYAPEENNSNNPAEVGFGSIVINEFVAKGSANTNEFGSSEDWIELYNNTQQTIQIGTNELYITDDYSGDPLQYVLPAMNITPSSYVLVWADQMDTVANAIHANFKLSSSGESIGVFLVKNGTTITLDTITYQLQTVNAVSNARIPDGTNNWGVLTTPTPNASNN